MQYCKRVLVLSIILFYSAFNTLAQDNIGISVGNHTGIQGAFLNPTEIANSKTYFDINWVSGNLYFQNNYIRILPYNRGIFQNTKIASAFFGTMIPGVEQRNIETLDRYTLPDKHGFANVRLTGPSVIYSIGNHAFAFQTSFRAFASALKAPYDIAKFSYVGLFYSPQHDINYEHPGQITGVSAGWNEIGFSYANTIQQSYDHKVIAGITLKGLLGYHGIFLHSTHARYMVPDRDTIHIYNLQATAGYSLPIDYDNNNFFGLNKPVRGLGFAMDMGVSYSKLFERPRLKTNRFRHHHSPYVYRVGLSLIDFGMIHFNQHSRRLRFDIVDTVTWGGLTGIDFLNTNHYVDTMSYSLTNNDRGLDDGSTFNIMLPSAMVLQFDYHIHKSLFINAIWMQNLAFVPVQVSRPSYLAITPRLELDNWGISLPFTLFRYREPRLGMAFRYRFLTLGTCKLGSFFGSSDYNGFSVYFSVRHGLSKTDYKKDKWECSPF